MNLKNIVLFGATGNIGSKMVPVFAPRANLTLTGRKTVMLEELTRPYDPKRVKTVPADATIPDDVTRVLETAATFGPIDLVIISAGSHIAVDLNTEPNEALRILRQHEREFMDIPFVVGTAAARVFRAQNHGLIVNLSSHVTARKDLGGNLTYRMTKKASEEFLDDLRNELAGTKVRITTIAPSTVNTAGNEKYLPTEEAKAKAVQPEAIANLILKNIDDPDVPAWQLMKGGIDFK